ncbi:MAG: serine/threonine protein kinase [Chloroflexi bacterium]|nr:serine/threonine protein kinase [Chloroflexota bacterium]
MTVLQTGDCVGRYEIQVVVGQGGFGRVYRAWDPEFERLVAIKELTGERKAREPAEYTEYLERFKLERRVQGQFQHPHIVSVYDLVQQDGDEYLIEEFVAGGTLDALIQQDGMVSPERVVQIGMEMCQAIAVAWEQDVVHRDVKPSNILLTGDGHAKLTDFGVAQIGQMSQRTQSDSHHPGTPAYMSPEQERAYGYLDERSDLYALGLVLYKALTGKSYKRERVRVRQLTSGVPKGLAEVVMCALAHDPADRYQRAAEFETALCHALDKSRSEWLWRVGGASALLVLIIVGWFFNRMGNQNPPVPTATITLAPSRTPTPLAPISTSTKTPTVMATLTPILTPTATSTPTATATPQSTPGPTVLAPRLIRPAGAKVLRTTHVTFRWEGELPDSGYGFRVILHRGDEGSDHASPILDSTQWTVDLPGDATSAVGEWRWFVMVVRSSETADQVLRSDEWTFYYNPFDGGTSPFQSPLPEPESPLPTPEP